LTASSKTIRIGLDLHTLHSLMQGSRTYIYNLTKALLEIDRSSEYYLYLPHGIDADSVPGGKNACSRSIWPDIRSIRLTVGFPARLAADHVDVFHCQYMAPLFSPCPYVVTIHDIIHEIHPEFYPGNLARMMKLLYPLSARRSAQVITGSDYSKGLINRIYRVPLERIAVTPYAVSDEFKPEPDAGRCEQTAAKYGIHGRYILFVGRIEPRKNIIGLLDAYDLVRERHGSDHKLVVVGMMDPLFKDFHEAIQSRKADKNVIFAGGVSQEDLPCVYSGADLFVYPSFAEGFGLPVLEAMACGVPVITSESGSLPEVVGDAGILLAPGDTSRLAETILDVLNDPDLRTDMTQKGLKQAARFSWRRTAEQTLDVYRKILEDS
jgi:glycosyltransferase involved in cell wall biosynthesis